MSSNTTAFPRALARTLLTAFGAFADLSRHLRYSRIRLLQLGTGIGESNVAGSGGGEPSVRIRGVSHPALFSQPPSELGYALTLPSNSIVSSWCALSPEVWEKVEHGVTFELSVERTGQVSSARLQLDPRRRLLDRRWRYLALRVPFEGKVRVVLKTTAAAGASEQKTWALWGDPRVEFRRSVAGTGEAARRAIVTRGIGGAWQRALQTAGRDPYALWLSQREPSRQELRAQREWSAASAPYLFSLVTFVDSSPPGEIRRTARSVFDQTYGQWEWLIAAPDEELRRIRSAMPRGGRSDERVRFVPVPLRTKRADAWNAAITLARGQSLALLGAGDCISPGALYAMARTIGRHPECDLVYSDEDHIAQSTMRRSGPKFKPAWSPELLVACNYIGRLTTLRKETVQAVGGFRSTYEGAEEWDLLLRLSRRKTLIVRLTECLYHRSPSGEEPGEAGRATLLDHCMQLGREADVVRADPGYRVNWKIRGQPFVSVIIPNRNAASVLRVCLDGLLHKTGYAHRELIIVDNDSDDPETKQYYEWLRRRNDTKIVQLGSRFNYSAACNTGVAAARGDLLLFLNNDIEVIDAGWLDELVRWAQWPEVGVVGAKLLYPNAAIQHAGIVFGLGLVGHMFSGANERTSGPFGSSESYRNYLAVTGACQMTRRDVFDAVGGYDERYQLEFGDVVYCMNAWKAGYRVIYTPYSRLVHHESLTRQKLGWPQDLRNLAQYLHSMEFQEDPYFHPELNPTSPTPRLRPPFEPPPRVVVEDYMAHVLSTPGVG